MPKESKLITFRIPPVILADSNYLRKGGTGTQKRNCIFFFPTSASASTTTTPLVHQTALMQFIHATQPLNAKSTTSTAILNNITAPILAATITTTTPTKKEEDNNNNN
jgi:hypothetical protein